MIDPPTHPLALASELVVSFAARAAKFDRPSLGVFDRNRPNLAWIRLNLDHVAPILPKLGQCRPNFAIGPEFDLKVALRPRAWHQRPRQVRTGEARSRREPPDGAGQQTENASSATQRPAQRSTSPPAGPADRLAARPSARASDGVARRESNKVRLLSDRAAAELGSVSGRSVVDVVSLGGDLGVVRGSIEGRPTI